MRSPRFHLAFGPTGACGRRWSVSASRSGAWPRSSPAWHGATHSSSLHERCSGSGKQVTIRPARRFWATTSRKKAGAGIVASTLGWRAAFYMTAVPGLIFAILAFGLREPLRGAAEAKGPQTQKAPSITWRTFLQLLQIPTLRSTIAAETALFFVLGGAAFWLPTYLSRRFGLGTGTAGTLAGGVLVVGLLAGSLLGGTIADRLTIR